MAIDKAIEYKMQGGKKPAKNYLGKQKTVSKVPVKWQSGPDTPPTELAYITEAEKDLLLKADLHGSLKDGPNTGPDGIMSLDSQGDYTRDRSSRGPQRSGGSRQSRDRNEQHMREILTGQKNIGQTTKTGPKTRKYAVPEYVQVKQPDGTYKNKYIGSGYKSYGQPSFLGNLFSRGAPGYRGIKGMPAFFGKPGFETRGVPGQEGFGYYSDIKNFGDTRDPVPLGIIGLLANLAEKFRKPKDMSEFNELGLLTDRVNPTFQNDLGNELMLSTQKTPERFLPNAGPKQVNIPAGDAVSTLANPELNRMKGYTDDYPNLGLITPTKEIPTVNGVPMINTSSVYQDNLDFFDNLNKGLVVNNEPPMVNTDNVMQGSVLDATPKKGIMQIISDWFSSFQKPETIVENAAEIVPTTTEDITIDGGMLKSPFMETQIQPRIIAAENAYDNQGKIFPESVGERIRMNMELGNRRGFMGPGFADGGLASMFTRRG